MALFVISVYLYARSLMPQGGETVKFENGYCIIDYVKFGSPIDKAGMRTGDTLVSINSMSIEQWEAKSYIPKPGDTLIGGILRNNLLVSLPVVVVSALSYAPGFFWSIYVIMIFFSIGSLQEQYL